MAGPSISTTTHDDTPSSSAADPSRRPLTTHDTAPNAGDDGTLTYQNYRYPAKLAPLTPQEVSLLDAYAAIQSYEREAARIRAEEAKRRLEEADERYRAKVREREREEGGGGGGGGDSDDDGEAAAAAAKGGDDFDDDNDGMAVSSSAATAKTTTKKNQKQQPDHAADNSHSSSEDEDEATKQIRRQTQRELSQLRNDVSAAREAQLRKEQKEEEAKRKEEQLRLELLGDAVVSGKRKRSDEVGYRDSDDEGDGASSSSEEEEEDYGRKNRSDIISGPTIKKKRTDHPANYGDDRATAAGQPGSLIANLSGSATPIHDFSKKLGMSPASLDGSVLYPFPNQPPEPWKPPTDPSDFTDRCLELELPDFDYPLLRGPHSHDLRHASSASSLTGNNTLAIKFHAPSSSSRFSLNLTLPHPLHQSYDRILFHFNPRQFQKGGQLVINDKQNTLWGNAINVPLSTMPLMFGKVACTLVVQIGEEGFDVFLEGVHCARLEHRWDWGMLKDILEEGGKKTVGRGSLMLQLPSSDDYGNPENWMVYRVWWGRKKSLAGDLDGVAGVNIYSAVHPRKLFLSNLPKVRTDPELDLRRAELERAFRKYGGPSGAVLVSVQKNSSIAFVEVASEQMADLALVQMAGKYRITKARRTKHEALMEERAKKEKDGGGGGGKEGVDWD